MNDDEAFDPMDAVAQMFSAAKAVLTPLEGQLWLMEVHRLGDARLMAFAAFWLSGESGSLRAPKVQDFRRYFDPGYFDEALAFDALVNLVGECGPYRSPTHDNVLMYAVIDRLGGWVEVCQQMPGPQDDFKLKRYKERFARAYQGALADQMQGLPPAPRPLGLCDQPIRPLTLGAASHELGDYLLIEGSDEGEGHGHR